MDEEILTDGTEPEEANAAGGEPDEAPGGGEPEEPADDSGEGGDETAEAPGPEEADTEAAEAARREEQSWKDRYYAEKTKSEEAARKTAEMGLVESIRRNGDALEAALLGKYGDAPQVRELSRMVRRQAEEMDLSRAAAAGRRSAEQVENARAVVRELEDFFVKNPEAVNPETARAFFADMNDRMGELRNFGATFTDVVALAHAGRPVPEIALRGLREKMERAGRAVLGDRERARRRLESDGRVRSRTGTMGAGPGGVKPPAKEMSYEEARMACRQWRDPDA